jgi:MYXO-CTERM domain-containing protein
LKKLMRSIRTSAVVAALAALCGSPAIAQPTTGSGPDTGRTTTTSSMHADDQTDRNWGWLGLLGLAGLGGLVRRDRNERREQNNVNTRTMPR